MKTNDYHDTQGLEHQVAMAQLRCRFKAREQCCSREEKKKERETERQRENNNKLTFFFFFFSFFLFLSFTPLLMLYNRMDSIAVTGCSYPDSPRNSRFRFKRKAIG